MQFLSMAALVVITLGAGVTLSAAVLHLILLALLRSGGRPVTPAQPVGDPLARPREGG